jgi:hypothetical protein
VHVVGGLRDVAADVAPVPRVQPGVVVAHRSRVQLHHQAVVERHAGELDDHQRTERLRVRRRRLAAQAAREDLGRLAGRQVQGPRGRVAVVGRRRTGRDERLPARAQRRQIPGVRAGVLAGHLAEPGDPPGPALELHVDHVVRPERGDHPAARSAPAVGGQLGVPGEVVQRRLGGGQHLDVEPFEQRPGPERRLGEASGDRVVHLVGGVRAQRRLDAEHGGEGPLQPQPRRRAAEQVPVLREQPPDGPRVLLDRRAVAGRYAQPLRRDALAQQHPGDVVVGHDDQVGGVAERLVAGQDLRVDVAVRRDQRQVTDQREQLPGEVALPGLGGEQKVGHGRSSGCRSGGRRGPARVT